MDSHAPSAKQRPLTDSYLAHLRTLGVDPGVLTDSAVASDLLSIAYRGRFLPSPVFLEPHEKVSVTADLLTVHDALAALPERLFEGSRARLGRAIGLTETQIGVAERAPAGALTVLARSDLYRSEEGFKLLELNITSALGGFENAHINRAMLAHPALAGFVADHHLEYADTLKAIVDSFRFDLGDRVQGRRPVVALADWPQSFTTYEPRLRVFAKLLDELGIEGIPCHVGQLGNDGNGLVVDGRRVDAVYRFFLLEEIVTPEDLALVEPVLSAADAGNVTLFARMDAELYGNKGALALLSDDRNAYAFTAREHESFRRILPWTRFVRAKATDFTGAEVDLLKFALAKQRQLILKPVMLHGGSGIVAGWTTGPQEWERHVQQAMDGPYVLQQRVLPAPEPFPSGGPGPENLYLNWGVFIADPRATHSDGYAGCIVRGTRDIDTGVVSMGSGALVGCCFHTRSGR